MRTVLLIAAVLFLSPATAGAQVPVPASDSMTELRSGTQVRVRIRMQGTAWRLGEIGRWAPSGCVFIAGNQTDSPDDGVGSHDLRMLDSLEVWRGAAGVTPDIRVDRNWVPVPLAALRKDAEAAACTKADRGT